jgi:carbonic anhydrase
MKKPHMCQALVISCIDFRFITKVRDFLINQGLEDKYDLITVPGASLGLKNIAAAILTSIRLHDPDQILIFDHEDCGAYGNNNSKKAHSENLKRARKILLEGRLNKKVKTYITGVKTTQEIT